MNTQNKTKMYCKNTSQKIAVVIRFEPSPLAVPHINSFHAFTMLVSSELGSELCNTLVIQRDFYTSIIVIVAFDAGIEAGSINYLPYIVLHARLYTIARR